MQIQDGYRWQMAAGVFCFFFGVLSIANIHPVGDGLWFWYAALFREHQRLYADMHLNLQPLFILANVFAQQLLGTGWLASKALAVSQLLAYCVGLLLVSRHLPWKDWQRAILIVAVFGMTITVHYYRFDDYHVTTHCFEIYSIYLLILLERTLSLPRTLTLVGLLGILSGLAVSNRLNDGAALVLACGMVLLYFVRTRRMLAIAVFVIAVPLTFLAVLALTGDTLNAWALDSVIRASSIKGGTDRILLFPLRLPFRVAFRFLDVGAILTLAYVAAVAAIAANLLHIIRTPGGRLRTGRVAVLALLIVLTQALFIQHASEGTGTQTLADIGVLIVLALAVPVHLAFYRHLFRAGAEDWNRLQLLLLIPFWQLIFAAMTSGRSKPEYEPAVALTLLLLPVSSPFSLSAMWQRRAYIAVAALIAIAAVPGKVMLPYAWHHYHARPWFAARQWYQHPVFGPMIIETDQLRFMLPMCAAIHETSPNPELLSLPYPYPNYFCNVKPWHGYVQTWYDTSGKETIDTLDRDLRAKPPLWIAYQRGLDSFTAHEHVFNADRPLPHRELDREIMDYVVKGEWTIVRRSCFSGTDWLLIRTTAPAPGEHKGTASDVADMGRSCPGSHVD